MSINKTKLIKELVDVLRIADSTEFSCDSIHRQAYNLGTVIARIKNIIAKIECGKI